MDHFHRRIMIFVKSILAGPLSLAITAILLLLLCGDCTHALTASEDCCWR